MKRKRQKREEVDKVYKKWFESSLQPWKFGTLPYICDLFERQLTENEREMSYRFWESVSRIFPSSENRNCNLYGFPIYIPPTIISHNIGFGNIISSYNHHQTLETKEPLEEIIETDKTVSITAEIPGAFKEDIELEITQNTVIIKVNNEKMDYYKKVELPCFVDADSAITSYQNDILDIELRKVILDKLFDDERIVGKKK